MTKCLNLCVFLFALCMAASYPVNAQTHDADADKVKSEVRLRGQGSKVVVTIKNGVKLKGTISQVLDDSFDLKDAKSGQPTTIDYRDIAKIKRSGLSKTTMALIAVGAAVVVVALIVTSNSGLPGRICPLGCGPRF